MRLRCPTCSVTTQIPNDATAFRCTNCQTLCTVPAGTKAGWGERLSQAGNALDSFGKNLIGLGFALLIVAIIVIVLFIR